MPVRQFMFGFRSNCTALPYSFGIHDSEHLPGASLSRQHAGTHAPCLPVGVALTCCWDSEQHQLVPFQSQHGAIGKGQQVLRPPRQHAGKEYGTDEAIDHIQGFKLQGETRRALIEREACYDRRGTLRQRGCGQKAAVVADIASCPHLSKVELLPVIGCECQHNRIH